jgi:phage terminase large subunit
MDLPEIGMEMRMKMNFYTKEFSAPPPHTKIADKACFAKDGRRSVAEILRDLTGIQFKESKKHDLVSSIDRLSARFSNNLITIDPRCTNTIRQLAELSWKYEAGESKKEVPQDIEDDAPDVLRYVDADLMAGVKSKPEKLSLKQQLQARDVARRSRMATGLDQNPNLWQAN